MDLLIPPPFAIHQYALQGDYASIQKCVKRGDDINYVKLII